MAFPGATPPPQAGPALPRGSRLDPVAELLKRIFGPRRRVPGAQQEDAAAAAATAGQVPGFEAPVVRGLPSITLPAERSTAQDQIGNLAALAALVRNLGGLGKGTP